MNRITLIILLLLAAGLILFNSTKLDLNSPFTGDSLVAVIGILAALCAMVLLLIFHISRKIQDKLK
jgi:uncharacterized integral membrane protein